MQFTEKLNSPCYILKTQRDSILRRNICIYCIPRAIIYVLHRYINTNIIYSPEIKKDVEPHHIVVTM